MSDHLYDPWSRLIRMVVLGKVFEVPENNLILRQLAYVAPDIASGKYCWNAECRYCEIEYRRGPDGAVTSGLSCRVRGLEGMELTKIAPEMRYNMSEALAAARKAEDK